MKKFSVGNLILKINLVVLVISAIYFFEYAVNYLEITKGFRIDCIWFFGSLILELVLYSIKHS